MKTIPGSHQSSIYSLTLIVRATIGNQIGSKSILLCAYVYKLKLKIWQRSLYSMRAKIFSLDSPAGYWKIINSKIPPVWWSTIWICKLLLIVAYYRCNQTNLHICAQRTAQPIRILAPPTKIPQGQNSLLRIATFWHPVKKHNAKFATHTYISR